MSYLTNAFAALGALSAFSTTLAHVLPWPKAAAFFARVGIATAKFAVEQKP